MKRIRVSDIRQLITKEASLVGPEDPLTKVAEEIVRDPKTRSVYVVDEEGKLLGIITVHLLIQFLYYPYIPAELISYDLPFLLSREPKAGDIMQPPVWARDDESVTDVLVKMFKHGLEELPVVDDEMRVVGDLNILEFIDAWLSLYRTRRPS